MACDFALCCTSNELNERKQWQGQKKTSLATAKIDLDIGGNHVFETGLCMAACHCGWPMMVLNLRSVLQFVENVFINVYRRILGTMPAKFCASTTGQFARCA